MDTPRGESLLFVGDDFGHTDLTPALPPTEPGTGTGAAGATQGTMGKLSEHAFARNSPVPLMSGLTRDAFGARLPGAPRGIDD